MTNPMNDEPDAPDDPASEFDERITACWHELVSGGGRSSDASRHGQRTDRMCDLSEEFPALRLFAAERSARGVAAETSDHGEATALDAGEELQSPLKPGDVLGGKYRILALVGRGNMGEVYAAWHLAAEHEVAVKILGAGLANSPDAIARFRKSIHEHYCLEGHARIATGLDVGEHDHRAFIVMEHVAGVDLMRYLKQRRPLPWQECCQYALQVAEGLAHAHAAGLVHRDIKPSNLIRQATGTVKIVDWGLVRNVAPKGEESSSLGTVPGAQMGTPDYMPPEQAKDGSGADGRSDLYSLGCTLYCLLAGDPPFKSEGSASARVRAHVEKPPAPLRSLRPDAPDVVEEIVNKLMAKRPEDRFQSANDVMTALNEVLASPESGAGLKRTTLRKLNERRFSPRRRAAMLLAIGGAGVLAWGILSLLPSAPRDVRLQKLTLHVQSKADQRPNQEDAYELVLGGQINGSAPFLSRATNMFRISGTLTAPSVWRIVWLDTKGNWNIAAEATTNTTTIAYPPKGAQKVASLKTDLRGTHVIVLLTETVDGALKKFASLAESKGVNLLPTSSSTQAVNMEPGVWLKDGEFVPARKTRGPNVVAGEMTPQLMMDAIEVGLPDGVSAVGAVFLEATD